MGSGVSALLDYALQPVIELYGSGSRLRRLRPDGYWTPLSGITGGEG